METRIANASYGTKKGRKSSGEFVGIGIHGKMSISRKTQEGLDSMSLFH
jgi:hypothetical protein